ncbi:T9SS type A sorting domain-containing protein [Aquimarina sp. ERC-38]|uniref:T9SS type A sorting domain-containing protein n=1 Tax=Aquimarina sp. ERC-38 TaxID=2949996 RepID=UPI00224625C7|nr:T9SS type A sorting domain-containing protein [Aquimarina sp. ERC-38]UZO79808.1 T9SS type A sorting domain-containing protein [Aquimarina sp. ERC-38]
MNFFILLKRYFKTPLQIAILFITTTIFAQTTCTLNSVEYDLTTSGTNKCGIGLLTLEINKGIAPFSVRLDNMGNNRSLGTSDLQVTTANFEVPAGDYQFKVTDNAGCETSQFVRINAIPLVFQLEGEADCITDTEALLQFTTNNTSLIATSTVGLYEVNADGSFTLVTQVSLGTGAFSSTMIKPNQVYEFRYDGNINGNCQYNQRFIYNSCNPTLNTQDIFVETTSSDINIYPNPTSGIVNIEGNLSSMGSIIVYDMLGAAKLEFSEIKVKTIDLQSLVPGHYFIQFNFDGRSITKRIIKE